MASINWEFGASGAWSDATKWSGGLVPTAGDDVTIDVAGTYAVSISKASAANSLTFNDVSATLSEASTGSLSVGGELDLEAGTVILRSANTFGSAAMSGGLLQIFKGNSLGAAGFTLDGGEFSAMANATVANELFIGATGATIDAATGTTLNLTQGQWELDGTSAPTLQFGSATRKGTVVWHTTPGAAITNEGTYVVDVAGGTLRAADSSFGFLLENGASTTIDTGAKIDLHGFSATIDDLLGGGDIVDNGASAALILKGATFTGVISGAVGVEVAGTTEFEAAQTYTGGTTIDAGQVLFTVDRGAVAGVIVDNGFLEDFDASGTFAAGPISGTGVVDLVADGALVLDHADSYSGGSNIFAGKIEAGAGTAFGSGAVSVDNAEIIGTASETLKNEFTFTGSDTVAASTGATVNFGGGDPMTWDASGTTLNLTFGDATHKGVVVIDAQGETETSGNPINVKVAYGTLKDDGGALEFFLNASPDPVTVTVSAGATLDLGGSGLVTPSLNSAGSIVNSGAEAELFTESTSKVSGTISGRIELNVSGALTLTGADTYTGGTDIDTGATLQLGANGATGSITGNIAGGGALIVDETGVVTLGGANTYTGGTTLLHGKLTVTNGKALGTGGVTLDSGTLLLASETMALGATQTGILTFNGTTTIAAAHGKTLTIGGAGVLVNQATLNFGAAGDDGTIVFKVAGGTVPGPYSMKVNFGTLKAGDTVFGELTLSATSVTVATGATLDLGGFAVDAHLLLGGGTVTDTGAKNILGDFGGLFTGRLTGALEFEIDGPVTLTGASTYTGGTTIDSSAILQLGSGGATGSITGNIIDNGVMAVDEAGKASLAGVISGGGSITQKGTGITTVSHANSFTGGVTIAHGELIAATGAALGAGGTITMTGGELLASGGGTFSHDLTTGGLTTFAAATGKSMILATDTDTLNAGTLFFGDSASKGVVEFKELGPLSIPDGSGTKIEVRDGTLRAGDGALATVLDDILSTKIDTGAVLDVDGHAAEIHSLNGSGALTNSGPATAIALFGTSDFSGVIAGKYSEVELLDGTTLSGNETFTGTAFLEGGTETLSGLFAESLDFDSASTLVLTTPANFTGTIEQFQSGDAVDLRNITKGGAATVSYDTATKVLTVSDGTHTDKLSFSGTYVRGNFKAVGDGAGGTDIEFQVVSAPPPGGSAAPLASAMAGFGAPAASAAANPAQTAPVSPLTALHAHG